MTSLAAQVDRLQMILRSEEGLYLRLRELLQREENEIIELDPHSISMTIEEKRALSEEGRLLEESRSIVTQELATMIGLEETLPKLSKIIETLGDQADELPSLHGRLSALVESSQRLLETNQQFAHRSLGRVRDTLRLLGRSVPEPVGYGRKGQASDQGGRGRLVQQAI